VLECLPAFLQPVEDDHEAGQRVGSPPGGQRVANEAKQYRASEIGVDERHSPLSQHYEVTQGDASARLSASQHDHHSDTQRCPDDPAG
jgi:hypothetical protein